MASARFRVERSAAGFRLGVLKSGVQKYVRRGLVAKALACADELFTIIDAAEPGSRDSKRITTNFRHRLQIIFLEDVGDVGMWAAVDELLRTFAPDTARKCIALMARAAKARICSHARAVATLPISSAPHQALARQYPDIARLCDRVEQAGASEPGWRAELAASLADRSDTAALWATLIKHRGARRRVGRRTRVEWQIFAALREAAPSDLLDLAERWFVDLQNLGESYMTWMLPILAHVGRHPYGLNAALVDADDAPLPRLQGVLVIDDYVLDMHTSHRGAKLGNCYTRFAIEGAHVENESKELLRPSWKHLYDNRKRLADGVEPVAWAPPQPIGGAAAVRVPAPALDNSVAAAEPVIVSMTALETAALAELNSFWFGESAVTEQPAARFETKAYELDVRAQLTTSDGKTDVYFARDCRTGEAVVVKGPLESKVQHHATVINEWKQTVGLPVQKGLRYEQLIPDRWPEGVPLGRRRRIDRGAPATFLIASSTVPLPVPRRLHRSKLWPETEVSDPARIRQWDPVAEWAAVDEQIQSDYAYGVLARYVTGVGDMADRNFVRQSGRLMSIDEDRVSARHTRIADNLRRRKSELVFGWLEDRRAAVEARLAEWAPPDVEGAATRLAALQDWPSLTQQFAT